MVLCCTNLQATNATEWKCNSSIITCHHNNYTLIVLTKKELQDWKYIRNSHINSIFFNGCQIIDIYDTSCQLSFWSCINHKFSWSSLAQRSESTSCTLRDGSSFGKAPRLVLEDELPALAKPTSGFFGFLASPTSRNSKKRLTRLWPNQDSEPFRRLRGTSKMVSSRLKHEQRIPIHERVQEIKAVSHVIDY